MRTAWLPAALKESRDDSNKRFFDSILPVFLRCCAAAV
jgi:hypothetical protein